MRKLALAVTLLFLVGIAMPLAQEAKGKTHDVTAEVVSIDASAKTITIKDAAGENKTVPVKGAAVEALKTINPGDMVVLTCQDNEKGEHQAIVAIKPVKPPKS